MDTPEGTSTKKQQEVKMTAEEIDREFFKSLREGLKIARSKPFDKDACDRFIETLKRDGLLP